MQRLRQLWVLLILSGFSTLVFATRVGLPDFSPLVEDYGKSVVNISTSQNLAVHAQLPHGFSIPDLPEDSPLAELFKHFLGDRMSPPGNSEAKSLGSGFIISTDGYVITNHHVVDGADEILVRTQDRREYRGQLVGSDERSDIALVKIDANELPVVKLGRDSKVKVGEWVLAIGSPFGFDHSATSGIVSALGRNLPTENYVPFIQTDVAINPGNSGGPLFNMDGEVIGVNSQIYSRTGGFMGLSFAIPIDVALNVVEQIKTSGHVKRGWLGIMIQDVNRDLAETFGMERPMGALVSQILPDGPAANTELRVGDVILEFNGQALETSAQLPPLVGTAPVGKKARLTLLRDGRKLTVQLMIGELPDEDNRPTPRKKSSGKSKGNTVELGMQLRDLTAAERKELELPGDKGVLVLDVQPGPAFAAGIRDNDVILMINGHDVKNVSQASALIKELKSGQSVAFLMQRGEGRLFVALRIPKKD